MNQRLIIAGVLLCVFGFGILVPTAKADWVFSQNDLDSSFQVGPLSHHAFSASRTSSQKEVISWNVTAGVGSGRPWPMTFFICDAANYALFVAAQGYTRYCLQQGVESWSGEFQFTSSDTWYFVWQNTAAITTKTIHATVDLYAYTTGTTGTTPPIPGFPAGAILIGAVLAIALPLVIRRRNRKQSSP